MSLEHDGDGVGGQLYGLGQAPAAKSRRAEDSTCGSSLQSLLPNFVIVDTAGEHDNKRARELCAGINSGEIVLFDKGYVDFGHLRDLDERGVFWVTRCQGQPGVCSVDQNEMPKSKDEKILRDEIVVLNNPHQPARS